MTVNKYKEVARMNADILFRIAAIGVLVTVIAQVLTRAGREDIATLPTKRIV